MILAAASGAPARMTPTVSHTAVAARPAAAAGGVPADTNSAINAVTRLLATAMSCSSRIFQACRQDPMECGPTR
jgi:hypothetical protein